MERGHIQGLPKLSEYPLLSQERLKLRTLKLAGIFTGPCEQKPFKIGRKWSVGVYRERRIFWVPPIIWGTGKATNFNFCTHILSIDRNRRPLQISGKVVGCVERTLKTFQCTHILGASRGLLCDSSAVLYLLYMHCSVIVDPRSLSRFYAKKRFHFSSRLC